MNSVCIGAAAGLAATGPMTLSMEAMHGELPASERYPLPPRLITMQVMRKVGALPHLTSRQRTALTLACHFGYGAGMGSAYALTAHRVPGHPLAKGVGFGLAVWGASYLGLLPAMGVLPPATRTPLRRNLLMIGAHVVWGGVCGVLVNALDKRRAPRRTAPRGQARAPSRRVPQRSEMNVLESVRSNNLSGVAADDQDR